MINVPHNVSSPEYDLYISGFKYCEGLVHDGISIKEAIKQTAERYAFLLSDKEEFISFLKSEVTTVVEPSVVLANPDLDDKEWWNKFLANDDCQQQYWKRYYDYLERKPSWSLKAINDINDSTDEIMNYIANPKSSVAVERTGLVFGYVQSGKTAHYIGLINKAIDSGYRIIIVLTGVHNSLRSQTQSRIDEEVLGYETSLENIGDNDEEKNAIGVGIGKNNAVSEFVQSITTRDEKGDVNAKTEGVTMVPPLIIVTKKNASVLRRIKNFFEKCPYAEISEKGKKYIPSKYPALIIDDEADQASINTKASYDDNGMILEDYNPTTINGLVRELLQKFSIRSYIGYTATPFANIFIPPHIESGKFGKDLYPKDFIVRAPRSELYIGAREFFGLKSGENTPSMPLREKITKGANYLGEGTKADDEVGPIPDELKRAVKYFLISTAVRNCRGQINKPNTMLVHIVRFVGQQNKIKKLLKEYYDEEIANYIQYGDKSIEAEFKAIWDEDYCLVKSKLSESFSKYMKGCSDVTWNEIWEEIHRLVDKKEITLYSVNGKSTDSLMYKSHEGKPYNVIVVGGDKLSRGLTLEGLTISYFTRGSNTYDTLMQMGRWFGYRPGYLDLCRLFTTQDLMERFEHISMATEDLASQFDFMNEAAQKTPLEFGLRVATHPEMSITSPNKLRTGQELKRDFSAKLSQTRVFDNDPVQFDYNFETVETLLYNIAPYRITAEQYEKTHKGRKQPGSHYFWENVPSHDIITFFEQYETSKTATRSNSKYMADYVRKLNEVGGLNKWTVCLINVKSSKANKPFEIARLPIESGIYREEGKGVDSYEKTCSIHTMTSAGHEYYDYDADEIKSVEDEAINYAHVESEDTKNEYIRKKTRNFEKGLLLLYPISDAGRLTEIQGDHKTPFGFAAVFPDRKNKGDLKTYRMTDIAIERDNNEFYN